jgi:X-Pro dipeptidyl-peptidase
LQPDDHIVKKGQKIGLLIFSSDQNFTLHPEPGTEITIDLSESSLSRPVVGGKSKWKAAQK